MKPLPNRVNLDHLKKQAKELIRLYRNGDPEAIGRFLHALPAAAARPPNEIAALGLRLHDAQSCVAREYGFASWTDLRSYAESRSTGSDARRWLELVYSGDVAGGLNPARPHVAIRMLAENPDLTTGDPYLACAAGDEAALRQATTRDPAWINRAGGPLDLPPLLAVTHSSLSRVSEFQERLLDSARFLLAAGADPNQRIGNRWPPASVQAPDGCTARTHR
jgi:hypothetical protein